MPPPNPPEDSLDRKPATPSELIEYDFDKSASLDVPGDWNSQEDKLLYYESTVWYRRLFDFTPSAAEARQFIHFGGANYEADVYLNGAKLGRHVGGFTRFSLRSRASSGRKAIRSWSA